jgi:multidrug efflux system membrane fusion protein
VAFSVPEDQLPVIRSQMKQHPLYVDASVPGTNIQAGKGRLTFVDNTVDTTTGTIRLKATFPNDDTRLWPGQFVDATLNLDVEHDVTVVPSEAVQNGLKGQFVYVVGNESKAELRLVNVGRSLSRLTVIEKGVAPGETVITDGQLRVVPGAVVQPAATGKAGKT